MGPGGLEPRPPPPHTRSYPPPRLGGKWSGDKHAPLPQSVICNKNEDLRNADLQNADLQYADLQNADLHNADLQYADLQNSNSQNELLHSRPPL